MKERTGMLPIRNDLNIFTYNCGNAKIIHAIFRRDTEIILREIMEEKDSRG
jgi:hypothetical protein